MLKKGPVSVGVPDCSVMVSSPKFTSRGLASPFSISLPSPPSFSPLQHFSVLLHYHFINSLLTKLIPHKVLSHRIKQCCETNIFSEPIIYVLIISNLRAI